MIVSGVLLSALAFSVKEDEFGWETRVAGLGLLAGGIVITGLMLRGRNRPRLAANRTGQESVPSRYRCPRCGKAAMDGAIKLMRGPAKTFPCKACGRNVGVSWSAMLAVVPIAAALFGTIQVDLLAARIALIVAGMGLACVIHLFAPLKPR